MAAPTAPALAAWLAATLGVRLRALRPVAGGCIHRSWCLELEGGGQLFAKTNAAAALPLLEAEAAGLRALAPWVAPPLQLPAVRALALVEETAVLVLSWLDLASGGPERSWWQLGEGLARLHRASRGGHGGRGYGFATDNFIGSAPQRNGWCQHWPQFFASARLQPQLERAAAAGRHLQGAQALLAQLPERLGAHAVEPVLVHGDLWAGNAAVLVGGDVALFDPASYWGDREVDLAMAHLFGGFPPAFFAGYEASWPLAAGAEGRRDLYNLYHLLNHANLFGGGYWRQAQACLDRLLA